MSAGQSEFPFFRPIQPLPSVTRLGAYRCAATEAANSKNRYSAKGTRIIIASHSTEWSRTSEWYDGKEAMGRAERPTTTGATIAAHSLAGGAFLHPARSAWLLALPRHVSRTPFEPGTGGALVQRGWVKLTQNAAWKPAATELQRSWLLTIAMLMSARTWCRSEARTHKSDYVGA